MNLGLGDFNGHIGQQIVGFVGGKVLMKQKWKEIY